MKKILLLSALFLLPVFAFSQKAYENITYKGKAVGYKITFNPASGYIDASEVKAIRCFKKSIFSMDWDESSAEDMWLSPYPKQEKANYFILKDVLKMDNEGVIFESIQGVYHLKGT